MGTKAKKMGRPIKAPKPGERAALGFRITAETKQKLVSAAEKSGRSQSQEAEFRIERTFADQRSMLESLDLIFGQEAAGILIMLGELMKEVGPIAYSYAAHKLDSLPTHTLDGSRQWSDNAYAFAQVTQAIASALDALKPPGDPTPPRFQSSLPREPGETAALDLNETFANLGTGFANTIIEEAGSGFTRKSGGVERARRMHRALGPLALRLRKFCNEEWLNASSHIGDGQ